MRVAQGLEPPDPNPEYSTARYFHDEAYLQLVNSKAMRGHYNEADAIAALHLVSFSLFSGGATNWRQVLSVAYEWVAQLGLPADENAQSKLMGMRPIEQVIVKTTMVSPNLPNLSAPTARTIKDLLYFLFSSSRCFFPTEITITHIISSCSGLISSQVSRFRRRLGSSACGNAY